MKNILIKSLLLTLATCTPVLAQSSKIPECNLKPGKVTVMVWSQSQRVFNNLSGLYPKTTHICQSTTKWTGTPWNRVEFYIWVTQTDYNNLTKEQKRYIEEAAAPFEVQYLDPNRKKRPFSY